MRKLFLFLLFALYALPLVILLTEVSPAALSEMLQQDNIQKSIFVTLTSATAAAAISTALGIFFARQFSTYQWRFKRLQRLFLLVPYLVPNFVLATAYVVSWNPTSGLLNNLLPIPFSLYGFIGLVVVYAVSHIPVAFLLLEDRYNRLDPALREAARMAGASSRSVFFRIECRLLFPSILSALCLCAALNLSAFAIPAWIGAPAKLYPLTYKIFQALQLDPTTGISDGAALSVVLYTCVAPFLILSAFGTRNQSRYITVSGKASRVSAHQQEKRSFRIFQTLYLVLQLFFWVAPFVTLFITTLVAPGCIQNEGLVPCLTNANLNSYSYVLFDLSETKMGFVQSFQYGLLASVFITLISMITLAITFKRPSLSRLTEILFAIPVASPGAIIALAFIVSFSGRFGLNLYNTASILVLAYIVKHTNLAFQPLKNGSQNLSMSLIEAGRMSGAGTFQTWRHIIFPILRPELLGGFCLVLIPIVGELTMSIFLSSPNFRPIGQVMFDLHDYADQNSAAAIAVILVVAIFIINGLAYRLSRGKVGY